VGQSRNDGGGLVQSLKAVDRAPDSPPHEDANASVPAHRCDRARGSSNRQEERSQNDVDYLGAERS